ncbi:glycosyltransferase family 4 protein [Anaerosinus sp.]|uniref:glycosyltransferase family 4 protein n=1 Tax=Selenobaculum sp. TaxID=3074374 RepID=UPI003AB46826
MEIYHYKICIDCRMIAHSGIGTYIKNLLPRIISCMENTYFFLIGDSSILNRMLSNIDDHKYEIIHTNIAIFSLKEQWKLVSLIPHGIDLYWCPNFNVPLLYKKKTLVTIHDVFHLAMPNLVGGWHKYYYAYFLLLIASKRSSKILTVSNFTKNEIMKYLKVVPDKIVSIPLGVDKKWLVNSNEKIVFFDKPYILFVGNIKPNKNILGLIRAFSLLKGKSNLNLIIVGKKDGFSTGDNSFRKEYLNSKDRIFFTGYISDEKLKEYYINAEVLVFPSLYEGFGLPILEAMASGCPVIASDRASIPETAGDAVIYCNPESPLDIAKKILIVYENKKLKEEMIKKGKVYVRNFQWGKCSSSTVEIINQLLVEGRGAIGK